MSFVARIIAAVGVALVVALAVLSLTADRDTAARYRVELDNVFGLTVGSEIRVAGVVVGTLDAIDLDRRSLRPVVEVSVTEPGFGDLREDAFCQARPQSLIGEYFLDCEPGTGARLARGGTIPVEQTASVVPLDLIQNILRRPFRERASIVFSELGIALSARGEDLNEIIRRASPALREVNRVLAILAEQRQTIRGLYEDGDTVLAEVAARRRDVGRFVAEARDTSRVYAAQAADVDRQLRALPGFLDELRPTLTALEATAQDQRPALAALREAAPQLRRTLETTERFSRASLPAVRSLASAARTGRPDVEAATPVLEQLADVVEPLPETATNAGIVFDHLDDPKYAPEKDVRAGRGPDGGFTGLELFARSGYGLSQALNWFDDDSYLLKITLYLDKVCGAYADAERAKSLPERCRGWLGPNQPGITTPDPTTGVARPAERRRTRRPAPEARPTSTPVPVPVTATPTPAPESRPDRRPTLPELPPLKVPGLGELPALPEQDAAPVQDVLDLLLGS